MFQDYFSSYRRDDGTNYLQTSRTNHCRYLSNNSSSAERVYETRWQPVQGWYYRLCTWLALAKQESCHCDIIIRWVCGTVNWQEFGITIIKCSQVGFSWLSIKTNSVHISKGGHEDGYEGKYRSEWIANSDNKLVQAYRLTCLSIQLGEILPFPMTASLPYFFAHNEWIANQVTIVWT